MRLLEGHTPDTLISDLALSAEGSQLYTAGHDGTIRRWDLVGGDRELLVRDNLPCVSVALAPSGAWLGWTTASSAHLRSLRKKDSDRVVRGPRANSWSRIRFSPDSRVAVVGDRSLSVCSPGSSAPRMLGERVALTNALAFSPDGEFLAAAQTVPLAEDVKLWIVHVYQFHSRELFCELDSGAPVGALAFSPDGRRLAATAGPRWFVWQVPEGTTVAGDSSDFSGTFHACAFTPDGRHLAVSRSDHSIRLIDTTTWRESADFEWGIGRVTCLAFTPDGMKAAAGGTAGKVVVWDVDE